MGNYELTHAHAKVCVRHLLSFNQPPELDDKLWLKFDADELRNARDEGRAAIKQVQGDFSHPDVAMPARLKGGGGGVEACGVSASCAHGLAFQLADALLSILATQGDSSLVPGELKNWYGKLNSEYERLKVQCLPFVYGIRVNRDRRTVQRDGFDKTVELPPIPWHIFSVCLAAAPEQATLEAMEQDYPGEWDSRHSVVQELNRRLQPLRLKVDHRKLVET